jgi:hypothetical protein
LTVNSRASALTVPQVLLILSVVGAALYVDAVVSSDRARLRHGGRDRAVRARVGALDPSILTDVGITLRRPERAIGWPPVAERALANEAVRPAVPHPGRRSLSRRHNVQPFRISRRRRPRPGAGYDRG